MINSAASGLKCWVTSNNPFVLPPLVPYAYFPNEYSQVVSPCFDFSNLVESRNQDEDLVGERI